MIRRTLISTILLITGITLAVAQPANKAEMLESLRVAYITKQLQLSPEEAQKFWPVYNTYKQEQHRITKDHKEKNGSELEFEEKMLNMRKRYRSDFTKAISEEKFDRLLKAERNWGDMLRKEIQRRRAGDDRPGPGPGPKRERPNN